MDRDALTTDAAADLAHFSLTARDLVNLFTGDHMPMAEALLTHDEAALTTLGSGVLWVDLVTGRAKHNGNEIAPLTAALQLQSWFRESLLAGGLPTTATQDASFTAALAWERYAAQRRADVRWENAPNAFIGCTADVRCRLAVGGIEVEWSATRQMEWPAPQ